MGQLGAQRVSSSSKKTKMTETNQELTKNQRFDLLTGMVYFLTEIFIVKIRSSPGGDDFEPSPPFRIEFPQYVIFEMIKEKCSRSISGQNHLNDHIQETTIHYCISEFPKRH